MCRHTSVYGDIRRFTSVYGDIRRFTSVYGDIRRYTSICVEHRSGAAVAWYVSVCVDIRADILRYMVIYVGIW